jgi:lipid-binding SYLF domain-containing protein
LAGNKPSTITAIQVFVFAEENIMKTAAIVLMLLCLGVFVNAQDADDNTKNNGKTSELEAATQTVQHMSAQAGDKGIPNQVLEGAKCVAVIPKLVKGAFVIGGEHGTGVATCRNNGTWSAPAPFSLSAGDPKSAGRRPIC